MIKTNRISVKQSMVVHTTTSSGPEELIFVSDPQPTVYAPIGFLCIGGPEIQSFNWNTHWHIWDTRAHGPKTILGWVDRL